jgi:hypothetical protein
VPRRLDPDPDKTFLLDPWADMVTGQKRNRVASRRHVWIALAAIAFALLAAVYALHEMDVAFARSAQMEREAVTVPGMITARRHQDGGREIYDRWFITYAFSAGQPPAEYRREITVERGVYDQLAEGTPILIKYWPADPQRSALAHLPLEPVDADLLLLILIGPALAALPVVVWAGWTALRVSRFERVGRVIQGEVESCTGEEVAGRYTITLRYRFRTPDDRELRGKVVQPREDLKGADLPKPGDALGILYVNDRLYRLL